MRPRPSFASVGLLEVTIFSKERPSRVMVGWRAASGLGDPRAEGGGGASATALHLRLAEQQPVDRDLLLEGEGDQEVHVRRGPALVAVHVLPADAEVPCELPLRAVAADLRQPFGKPALEFI